jgi:UDP-N-acetylglucosamine 1-carboxyvinyltransferase
LLDGVTVLHNVPRIADVQTMISLLRALGLTVEERDQALRITNQGIARCRAADDLVPRMRASHYLLAPLLLRLGRAEMTMPGGCDLGARPVTHILSVIEALGADSTVTDRDISLRAAGLRGGVVTLDPRHRNPGATFTALMAASLADGETTIQNASHEPDVVHFCRFLTAAGAQIEGLGRPRLTVRGVAALRGIEHHINCDRLEAGTFICAAAATRGEVTVQEITPAELGETAAKLQEAGVELTLVGRGRRTPPAVPPGRAGLRQPAAGLRVACPRRPRGVDIVTDPFPAFSTDLQPVVAALLATAQGRTTIEETVYDRRLQWAQELAKMGAEIELPDSRHAVIHGVERLRGAAVEGRNIRDGAALVVAALSAEGESTVSGRQYVARGYEDFEGKLRSLGAEIQEV